MNCSKLLFGRSLQYLQWGESFSGRRSMCQRPFFSRETRKRASGKRGEGADQAAGNERGSPWTKDPVGIGPVRARSGQEYKRVTGRKEKDRNGGGNPEKKDRIKIGRGLNAV